MLSRLTIATTFTFLICLAITNFAQAQPVKVVKANPAKVYMHYMPWFDGPAKPVAGQTYNWGWHWKMNTKNPNLVNESGKRQIAAHFYPLIGPYASIDPDVIEYHLLLMKLAGVDGILLDWYGQQGSNGDVGSLLNNSNALINHTDETGLDFALILEDRFWSSVAQAGTNIAYAKTNYFDRPNYIRIEQEMDPLLGIFGPIKFQTPANWTTILSNAGEDVSFLTLWYESNDAGANADGEYEWIYSDFLAGLTNFYTTRAPGLNHSGGIAYPGFKDYYAQGGAGNTLFTIEHNNGTTLDQTLGKFNDFKSNVDFLQLATFNDFGEGTMFEPTLEFGFKFLAKIQAFTGVAYDESDLLSVYQLFTLRKRYDNNAEKKQLLDSAFNCFTKLELDQAKALLKVVDNERNSTPFSADGKLQAESFSAKAGSTITEPSLDKDGGFNVGWISAEDTLSYAVTVPESETYLLKFRVSGYENGGTLLLKNGSATITTVEVPTSSSLQNWSTVTVLADLPGGSHKLDVIATAGSFALNWIEFKSFSALAVEKDHVGDVTYWPTLVDDYLNVNTNGSFNFMEIFDMAGRSQHMDTTILGKKNITVDLSHLNKGVHMIKLQAVDKNAWFRIVKK
jgi:hypothetical protein